MVKGRSSKVSVNFVAFSTHDCEKNSGRLFAPKVAFLAHYHEKCLLSSRQVSLVFFYQFWEAKKRLITWEGSFVEWLNSLPANQVHRWFWSLGDRFCWWIQSCGNWFHWQTILRWRLSNTLPLSHPSDLLATQASFHLLSLMWTLWLLWPLWSSWCMLLLRRGCGNQVVHVTEKRDGSWPQWLANCCCRFVFVVVFLQLLFAMAVLNLESWNFSSVAEQ